MIINTETHELESSRKISQATGIPLPRNPPAETLAQLAPPRAYVVDSEPPAGDVVEPSGFEKGEDGEWRQAWSVRDYTADELAQRLADAQDVKRREIEDARKAAEAQGITLNGIRYGGDPENRQALREAVDLADAQSLNTFPSWKDSDDQFHADHPVADVRQALLDIAARRSQLIEREAQLAAQIQAATLETIDTITW
ncbi:DUF4376 domain-containing protein [Modicisalibacter sp. MOD 31.J]|uniref:DUF4376 domain-containing protein n=1 Tax=Modicisalibacter sp. MOD 31.J TaxID=2831897 RepID=UPI001CCDF2CB|nr:DUF4376 domain-containing protein [Modicisalibacter sp. MOD 31.J]MBZ9576732.1 DUF4376 domain-containing protein [Modicisalibacter sp. MOD 31.J]